MIFKSIKVEKETTFYIPYVIACASGRIVQSIQPSFQSDLQFQVMKHTHLVNFNL